MRKTASSLLRSGACLPRDRVLSNFEAMELLQFSFTSLLPNSMVTCYLGAELLRNFEAIELLKLSFFHMTLIQEFLDEPCVGKG